MDSRTISQLAFGGRTKQLIGQPYRRSSFRTRPYAPDQGTRNPSVYHSHGDQPKSKNTAIDGEDPEFSRPENTGHGKENVRAKLSARTLMASGRHMPDSAVFQRHPCRKGLFFSSIRARGNAKDLEMSPPLVADCAASKRASATAQDSVQARSSCLLCFRAGWASCSCYPVLYKTTSLEPRT